MQKEVIGNCTLYCGDTMEILPTIKNVDLVASDVPYALTTGGKSKSSKIMSGIFAMHNYPNDGQLVMATVPFPEMLQAIHDCLKPDADCYIMSNDKNVYPLLKAAFEAGFSLHNILTWDKVTPTANRWYMKHIEFTLYFWKGAAKTINFPESKQQLRSGIRNLTNHPTEKPVSLMFEYIRNSSAYGETVCDPFMGSGTTGVAAVQLGRKFIGIEKSQEFFDLTCNRVEEAYQNPLMFSCPSATEIQEALL